MTDFNLPEPAVDSEKPFCPKLEPFQPVINEWLIADKKAPLKQRHTAKRVYDRLRKEKPDFNCSKRFVEQYVAHKKGELKLAVKEGFISLNHNPEDSQADFGSADFNESGIHHSFKSFG